MSVIRPTGGSDSVTLARNERSITHRGVGHSRMAGRLQRAMEQSISRTRGRQEYPLFIVYRTTQASGSGAVLCRKRGGVHRADLYAPAAIPLSQAAVRIGSPGGHRGAAPDLL